MTDDIKDWLNSQHCWIQEAAHRILSNGELSSANLSELIELIKNPPEDSDEERSYPSIGAGISGGSDLKLVSIGNIEGIDALNPKKHLTFGDGNLSVIYGDNGAGKSGYTRILKKICGKARAAELKPNVYKEAPGKQQCSVVYSIDGEKIPIDWQANSAPIEALTDIDIFDTLSGRIYLEDETELSYAPDELTLFADLVKACKQVDEHLSVEQSRLTSQLPSIPRIHEGADVAQIYSEFDHDIPVDHLDALLLWGEDEEASLVALTQRLKTMDPAADAKKRRAVKGEIDNLREALAEAVQSVDLDACNAIAELRSTADSKRKEAAEGAAAITSSAELEGVGSDTWRSLWVAARDYSTASAYPEKTYPQTADDSRCVLCHQELDEGAKKRFSDFENYVSGKLEADAKNAEDALEKALDELPDRPKEAELQTAAQASGLSEEEVKQLLKSWDDVDAIVGQLQTIKVSGELPVMSPATLEFITLLVERSDAIGVAATQLEEDAGTFDKTRAVKEKQELEARKWVAEQEVAVRAEISRLQEVEAYDQWKKTTGTTGISRKAGVLSQELITEAYISRFNDELRKLGAKRVKVELIKTRTKEGRSMHRVQLKDLTAARANISEVLSEGECRIVALAAFLADVTGRDIKSPFIFDDPISSMDQTFEEKSIQRLIELSEDRQVLVFTHRLSFLGIMNDKAGSAINNVHIRREPWGAGEPGEVPMFAKRPDKALNSLKNDRLVRAKKLLNEDGYDAYYPLAKAICSDFRILNERIVETVFLADVVQRHRRAVNTMGKVGNLAKICTDDCALIDEMMTKYSSHEHSQPDESPVELPDPDELEQDVNKMIDWHKEFLGRAI